jgi:LEA14-like dessication related protein
MKRRLFTVLFAAAIFTSCVSYKEVQLTGIAFKDVNTSNNKLRVGLNVEVDNPNKYSIKLSRPRLNVYVGKKALNDWSCPQKIKIYRNSKRAYPFYIEVSGTEALQLLPLMFMNPAIKIEGSIKAGWFIFGKRIPLSVEEKLY